MEQHLQAMSLEPAYSDFSYLTFDDIRMMGQATGNTHVLIAVKAPMGTIVEVPQVEKESQQLSDKPY